MWHILFDVKERSEQISGTEHSLMISMHFITWMESEACFWALSLFQVNYNCHFYKFLGGKIIVLSIKPLKADICIRIFEAHWNVVTLLIAAKMWKYTLSESSLCKMSPSNSPLLSKTKQGKKMIPCIWLLLLCLKKVDCQSKNQWARNC